MSPASQTESLTAQCTECDAGITFERTPLLGEVVNCNVCGAELEIVNRAPVTLQLAPEVEEDWGE